MRGVKVGKVKANVGSGSRRSEGNEERRTR